MYGPEAVVTAYIPEHLVVPPPHTKELVVKEHPLQGPVYVVHKTWIVCNIQTTDITVTSPCGGHPSQVNSC